MDQQQDEQDVEFEAFLRQFRPRTPPSFKPGRLSRLVTPRTLAIAAAIVLACAIPARFVWNQRASPGQNQSASPGQRIAVDGLARVRQEKPERRDSALNRALNIIPSVETALSAFTPAGTLQDRADVALPAAPRRKVLTRVKPEYPPEAQRLGLEADVVLRLTVNQAGFVTATERTSGVIKLRPDEENASERAEFYAANPYAFAMAAEAAALQWKFEAAESGMTCFVSFTFRLKPGGAVNTTAPSPGSGSATLTPVPGSSRPGLPVVSRPIQGDGQTVKSPKRLVNVNPVYPEDARAAHVGGVVVLEITIGENGSVTDARVMRSIPMLDQAAIDAALQWIYEPTLLNGVPIEVKLTVTINFTRQ